MAKTEEGGRNRVVVDCPTEEEEVELSLGLSLNGRFGIDPKGRKLTRSSSIPDLNGGNGFCWASSLVRACSLPAETAEEWRMAAKRKRSEKQGSFNKLPPLPPSSMASLGSQGSGSSAISEAETQLLPTQAQSPTSNQSSPESDRKLPLNPAGVGKEKETEKLMRNILVAMPCVSTRGDGRTGKRIEGFLYRYRKGEEVRIVCVCHGRFLSPAEFIRHAGGGQVARPLKHIVVSPFL